MTAQPEKEAWSTPHLVYFGSVADLVQGAGKSGDNPDSDPIVTSKGGGG